jgi:transcriptional regulator with XRE-family HTH domain
MQVFASVNDGVGTAAAMRDTQQHQQGPDSPEEAPGPVAVAFGKRIRALRGEQSLRAFAKQIGHVSAGHLCEVEHGKAKPSLRFVLRLEELRATDGSLAKDYPALLKEWDARAEARAERRRQLARAQRHEPAGRVRPGAPDGVESADRAPGGYPGTAEPLSGARTTAAKEHEANRREAVKAGLGAALTAASMRARDFLRWAESSNVGPLTLEGFDESAQWLAENASILPAPKLFLVADRGFADVAGLLQDGRQSSKQRAHLELLAGQFSYMQGRFAFMLGDHAAAQDHLRVTRHYGQQLGHRLLLASAALGESGIAFYQGRLTKALQVMQAAQQYATPYTEARIYANLARIYGSMGPAFYREMDAAVTRAEASLQDRPVVEPGAESPFGGELFAFYRSTAYCRAEDERTEQAAREALRAFERLAGEHPNYEDQALARLNLAAALVTQKHPDPREAARVGIQALAAPRQFQTDTVKRRGREVLMAMSARWPNMPAVKEFAEVVRGYRPLALPPPSRPQLPSG